METSSATPANAHAKHDPKMGVLLAILADAATTPAAGHSACGTGRTCLPCAHVVILDGEKDRHLAKGMMFEDSVTLVSPGPYQLAATQAALRRMTPMLCQSVGRIAFGRVPGNTTVMGAVNSFGAGDLILINTNGELSEDRLEEMISRRLFLQRTILHEAGHSAETLLNLQSSNPPKGYRGKWIAEGREMAGEVIEHMRLENGLTNEWKRLHRSFADFGWAVGYRSFFEDPESRKEWARDQVANGGFMSWGGAKNWAEDIATFVGSTYMSQTITEAYREHEVSEDLREDLGCQEMQAHEEKNLPSRFAAIYTKLLFLQDLGLVRAEDVRACMGASLGLPIDGEGFVIWQGTHQLMKLSDNLTASIGAETLKNRVFSITASGESEYLENSYPTTLRLQLDLGRRFDYLGKVSWPRGVYKLGSPGGNQLEIRLDGPQQANLDSMGGFVLVTEASNLRIAGSMVVQRGIRPDDPQPNPEDFEPPWIIRFLIEN